MFNYEIDVAATLTQILVTATHLQQQICFQQAMRLAVAEKSRVFSRIHGKDIFYFLNILLSRCNLAAFQTFF